MLTDAVLTLVDLALIVVVARGGGALALRFGQPSIAGELAAVILVGPTVLGGQIEGVVAGEPGSGLVHSVFPPFAVDVLTLTGTVGLILYMLLVGISIDPAPMRRRAATIAALAITTLAAMAGMAVVIAPWLEDAGGWMAPGAHSGEFVLALAAGLGANGVPVVARILEDRSLLRSEFGALVIAAAGVITTVALLVAGVAIRGGDAGAAGRQLLIVGAAIALVAAVAIVGRGRRMAPGPRAAIAGLLVIALAAGFAGKGLIGTALVGPLVVGIAVRGTGFAAGFFEARLGTLVRHGLLPVFLAVAALHVNLREIGPPVIGAALAIIAALVLIKLVVSYATARLAGVARSEAVGVAALLQCGGIMTIAISLDVLDAEIISTRLHALLTLIGLVTTVIAGPLLARARLNGHDNVQSH